MHEFSFSWNTAILPRPADADRCRRGLERWAALARETTDAGLASFIAAAPTHPAVGPLLEAVFGNSPFLSSCLLREPAVVAETLEAGPDEAFARLLAATSDALRAETDTTRLMKALRVAKRRVALLVALADIGGAWPLDRVTGALSRFADTATGLAVAHLLRQEAATGELVLPHPETPDLRSGYLVLGMGKLGASELNYSSDIDLIVLYDSERLTYTGRRSLRECMVRVTRNLVRILSERTADGYVFRTDLRLRPDPGSTPVAIAIDAALVYYESFGQNWERAAMIKARCIAGDMEAGTAFLRDLRPYVWRRSLDFNAIQDIHSIKRQIHAHKGGGTIAVGGHNIKLGRGGIREIEFFAQTQQLIWGGREPAMRSSRTCDALRALAGGGHVGTEVAEEMIAAYHYLRRLEHRLQMVDDQQTQLLPAEPARLAEVAAFMGCADTAAFSAELMGYLETVERHYAALFEEAPALTTGGNLVFTGAEDDPATLDTLHGMGFTNAESVSAAIRGWHHGRYRAVRTARARELLTELMPTLLVALADTANPDLAFMKFDEFLKRLPGGVQIFSLLHSNPALLDTVAEILGDAPRLAEGLTRRPSLVDNMLSQGFLAPLPDAETLMVELDARLAEARDYEDVLDACRRWANDRRFQVGVQILRSVVHPYAAAQALSVIADAVLSRLYPRVEMEFARQHGYIPGSGMAIIALGKMGSREMTASSDLDLILVYDAPSEAEASTGPRPLPATAFFTRIAQRFINAITALTNAGRLYDVDMRLRPSGSKGPLATSVQSFERYHLEDAWTWEHMALTRARVVYGPPNFAGRLETAMRDTLVRPRDPDKLLRDVADMRERMFREKRPTSPWEMKHARGGLVDIEFIAQYLQLRHAADHPEVLATGTAKALERLRAAGLLADQAAAVLLSAHEFWSALQGVLRQGLEGTFDERTAPPGLKGKLVKATGAADFDDLKHRMETHATAAHAVFRDLIEDPARRLG
ncbi:MAG: bifunctional [glutamine synthetase] adenylyltransferase/[glutamine synthetase]-adenylyl-L-tyrosine phosphorylase [Alphaproteobacteria bacterium]